MFIEGGHNAVIEMYKSHKDYQSLIRFVKRHEIRLLTDAYIFIGNEMRKEQKCREAEKYFLSAGDWRSVLEMHVENSRWDEAIRTAKVHGTTSALNEVASQYWGVSLNNLEKVSYHAFRNGSRRDLCCEAIDYAVQSRRFVEALDIAENFANGRKAEIHLKYAAFLEDEGQFREAEEHFIKGG